MKGHIVKIAHDQYGSMVRDLNFGSVLNFCTNFWGFFFILTLCGPALFQSHLSSVIYLFWWIICHQLLASWCINYVYQILSGTCLHFLHRWWHKTDNKGSFAVMLIISGYSAHIFECFFLVEFLINLCWLQIVIRELQTSLKELVLDKVITLPAHYKSCS